MQVDPSYKIGNCQILPLEYAIQFEGCDKQSLQPKFIEVLNYLATHYPRIIPREELIENIWDGNIYVGEKALTNTVWHLRQNLKGINDGNDVIETIRKVGYRLLISPVFEENVESSSIAPSQEATHVTAQISKPANKSSGLFHYLSYTTMLIVAILTFWLWPDDHSQFDAPEIIQITKEPGSELFASPSPNGRFIVYRWLKTDGSHNLYMRDTQQPELAAKQLTFDDDRQGLSAWGIEGKYLYFSKKGPRQCHIIRLNVATGQEHNLTKCPNSGGYYYLDISPDNKTLAFHGKEESVDIPGIYFLSLDNPEQKPVRFSCLQKCGYKDRDMAFSPDGKHIAVTRRFNRFSENVFLVNLKSKDTIQLTSNEEDIVGITWHPSGEQLVYATQRADVRTGYIVNIDDKHKHKLDIEGFSYPEFSKKSGQLFYQHRKEKYFIASLSLAKNIISSPFPVIQSDFNHHYPDYSNESGKMVYVSNESGFYELWLANADGTDREKLTSLTQTIRYPKWNNAGTQIAFLAPHENELSDKIYVFDMQSRKLNVVNSSFVKHNRPTWSYDDSQVISAVYTKEYTDLFSFNLKTGNEVRLTQDGGRYGIMTSPTTLLYTNLKDGLWQKNISKNERPIKKIDAKIFDALYTWHYQNNGIYYRKNHEKHHEIAFYNFDKQQVNPLVHLPPRTFETYGTLSFVAKDNKLLFTSALYPQADIKRLKHPLLSH